MRARPLVSLLCLLAACGPPSLPVTLTATPSAAPVDAMACAQKKVGSLGYRLKAFDDQELRLQVRKPDETAHRPDPQFRRNNEELDITAVPGADGKTTLTVVGHTFAELETHRGPTEEEQRASTGVKESAQAILDACGQP